MSIITKNITLYGYKCEACGYDKTDLEQGGSDKRYNFCGACGVKLSDDTQSRKTDNTERPL